VHPGPKAEGAAQTDFQPCSEQKRGKFSKGHPKKRPVSVGKHAKPSRVKRSESYAASNWLWSDPENVPFMFDPTCEHSFIRGVFFDRS